MWILLRNFAILVKINGEMHTGGLLDVLSRYELITVLIKESYRVIQERKECSQKALVIHR